MSRRSEVAIALAEGVNAEVLECAAHEVGHGLCWVAGGFGIKEMVISRGWLFGGISDAYCQCRDLRLTGDNIEAYLIGLAGGAAGQIRHLTKHQGHGGWRASGRADGNASHDRSAFRRLGRAHGCRLSWSAAVDKARRIIDDRSGRHYRLTVALARSGQLSGGAL